MYQEEDATMRSATKSIIAVHANLVSLQKEIRIACTEGMATGEQFALAEAECELDDADTKKLERIKKELQRDSPTKGPEGLGGYAKKRQREDKSQKLCYGCGEYGHYRTDPECPRNQQWAGYSQYGQ